MSPTSLRFWSDVNVAPQGDGFAILLDGRPARLPGGDALVAPTLSLADAMAAEWSHAGGQKGGRFTPDDIGLTRLCGTMTARVTLRRDVVIESLVGYGAGDVLCYRADAGSLLAARQAQLWQPLLDWMQTRHGVVLHWHYGVMPIRQDDLAMAGLRGVLADRGDAALTALSVLTPSLGSLVLALAVLDRRLESREAVQLSQLDEIVQMEIWGEDPALLAEHERLVRETAEVFLFVRLVQDEAGQSEARA